MEFGINPNLRSHWRRETDIALRRLSGALGQLATRSRAPSFDQMRATGSCLKSVV